MSVDKALRQSMQDQIKSKVVWKNASPASEMGAQNIPIDLSDWEEVEITLGNNATKMETVILAKGDSTRLYSNGVNTYNREYSVNEAGITLGAGNPNANASKPFTIYARKIIGGGL